MDDNSVKSGNKFREPYRATKLWLEAVAIFRRGVPLGKHRRQWKNYENCFVAQDAITWFQSQLQIAFDPSISRKQTLTLLQKFYKANIITEASKGPGNSPTVINETDFKDNGHLYKLVCTSSSPSRRKTDNQVQNSRLKVTSKPETPRSQTLPKTTLKYDVVIKTLTADQINQIWEQTFINKFVQIVGYDVFTSFYKPELFNGSSIAYNLTQLGPHNIVLTANKNDDLPHWLVSAMKCLANWPNSHTQESGIPNYPGFENDVFKLISDYFISFSKNKSPLLTYALYDAFITTFIRAELFDFNSRLYSAKISSNNPRSRVFQQMITPSKANTLSQFVPQSPMFKLEDQYPFNASESVENLIIDILTPAKTSMKNRVTAQLNARKKLFNPNQMNIISSNEQNLNCNHVKPSSLIIKNEIKGEHEDETVQVTKAAVENLCALSTTICNSPPHPLPSSMACASTTSIPVIPQAMPPQDYNVNRYTNPIFYETAFTANSPITRVVSHTELKATLGNKSATTMRNQSNNNKGKTVTRGITRIRPPAQSADAILDSSTSNYAYENPFLELSGSDLINHPKYSRLLEAASSDLQIHPSNSVDNNALSSSSFWNYSRNSSAGSGYVTGTESSSTTSTSTNGHNISLDGFMGKTLRTVSAINLSDAVKDRHPYASTGGVRHGGRIYGQSLASHLSNSPSKSVKKMLEYYYGADACVPGLMTTEGKSLAILSFRLLTLLLPPVNRRHLQILLRFMSKTSRNDKLMLDVAVSTRAMIINTFFRSILRSENAEEYDELLALRIVTFLMDNDHEIFSVSEDNDIVTLAQEQISKEQVIKVPTIVPAPEENLNAEKTNCNMNDNENKLNDFDIYAEANKENNLQFCSRITMDEFEDQRLLSSTSVCLRELLDTLVKNDKLDDKEKKKQILKFKDEYPHIYGEKFGNDEVPSFLNDSCKSKGKKEKKLWNPFRSLRL